MILQISRRTSLNLSLRYLPVSGALSRVWNQKRMCFPQQLEYKCNVCLKSFGTSTVSYKESPLIAKIKNGIDLSVFKSVNFTELKNSPFPAIVYGFGGIIPFVFPPLYFLLVSYSPFLATSQLYYGVTILAFVGGLKWGNAIAKGDISHKQIGISTIPSLVAWTSLLVFEPLGFLMVSSGLLGALYVDLVSSKYPAWFCALRSSLTGIAVGSLITTLFCHLLH